MDSKTSDVDCCLPRSCNPAGILRIGCLVELVVSKIESVTFNFYQKDNIILKSQVGKMFLVRVKSNQIAGGNMKIT